MSATEPVVIGLGTEHRRDDAAGLAVLARLRAAFPGDARLVTDVADAADLLERWSGRGRVVVVDATRSGRPPGSVVHLGGDDPRIAALPPATSSHGLTLADAIALGRALGRLPRELAVIGIEAGDVAPGVGLTPEVAAATRRVADELAAGLGDARPGGDGRA